MNESNIENKYATETEPVICKVFSRFISHQRGSLGECLNLGIDLL